MNTVIETLKSHRSFRQYLDKDIPNKIVDTLVEATQAAPSWVNGQQVSIILIKDKEKKQNLAELCGNQKWITEAPIFFVFCADFYRAKLASEMENTSFDAAEQSDVLLVGATDVGISLANMITAAESLGLGTVPIGGIRRNVSDVIDLLQLPEYVIPISGLCVGYPANDPGKKPRLPKESVLHLEKYNKDQIELLNAYNQTFKDYLKQRGDQEANWTKRMANFYSKPYYPSIGKVLKKQGFTSSDLND